MATYTGQFNKKTTLAGDFNAAATSLTLSTAAFTNFSNGYLVVDYDNDSKIEVIKCTVSGTSVTSITRGQEGTSDVNHASGAKIGFHFVPAMYAAVFDGSGGSTFPKARVYNTGNVSIPDSVETALTFDSERYDIGSLHSTSLNTGRLTATTAGKYAFTGHVSFASNATGYRQVRILLNGTTPIASVRVAAFSGASTVLSVPCEYDLALNDYVVLACTQTSGSPINAEAAGNISPEFAMHLLP